MRNNKFLVSLIACFALAVAGQAQAASYLVTLGSNNATVGNTIVSTTTTVAGTGAGQLFVFTFTGGAAVAPVAPTGCTANTQSGQTTGTNTVNIFSYSCTSGGVPIGTVLGTSGTSTAIGALIWARYAPSSANLTTQDKTGGNTGATAAPTFTTTTFTTAPQSIIEATGIGAGQPVENAAPGCINDGDVPNGLSSGIDLWVSVCPIASAGSTFTYTSSLTPNTSHGWLAAYTSYNVSGGAPACGTRRTMTGAGC